MDKKGFSDEAKNNVQGKSKSSIKYLTYAEFTFPLAKSPQCIAQYKIRRSGMLYRAGHTSQISPIFMRGTINYCNENILIWRLVGSSNYAFFKAFLHAKSDIHFILSW